MCDYHCHVNSSDKLNKYISFSVQWFAVFIIVDVVVNVVQLDVLARNIPGRPVDV